jgi:hypothetical protein
MWKLCSLALVAIVISLPSVAFSQDARSILDTAQKKQLERWEGVDVYMVEQSMVGNVVKTYFQRTEFEDDAGDTQAVFLPASNAATRAGQCMGPQTMGPEFWDDYAASAEITGAALGSEFENGLEEAGLPGDLFSSMGSEGTVSADPRMMMGNNAKFARAMAQAQRDEAARDPSAEAAQEASRTAEIIDTATLIDTETVDGRNAYHLRADNIGQVQEADGSEFKMDTINIWIDAREYVPLRMTMEGTLTADGQTRPMTIENIQTDYRTVPGSRMYESYRQVMKISGMMDPAQEAEMRKAAKQMAEMEKQMASMPASQRKMMESMMGPQLEMMKSMASGGGFQTEVITSSITVNPPMTGVDGKPCPTSGSQSLSAQDSAVPQDESEKRLISTIQVNLASLGYETDTNDGTMTTRTAIAISQFENANGLKVTGKPTPRVAGLLEAQLAGLSKEDLTTDYLEGHWCTEVTQERSLYKFAADGSYRVGVVGITITQMDGINYFPETNSRQSFFDKFERVHSKDKDRFAVLNKRGYELAFTRGNCFE